MSDTGRILSIFGLDGILNLRNNKSQVNNTVGVQFSGQLSDPEYIIAVISDEITDKHSEVWRWLLKNFKLSNYPKSTYLLLRKNGERKEVSAARHLSFLLGKRPQPSRVYCLDLDVPLLSTYREVIKKSGVHFWRLQTLDDNNNIITVESSFADRS